MIITVQDIRKIRQIAENVDEDRVNIYIDEAEKIDLLPAIGAELYHKFTSLHGAILVNEQGQKLQDESGATIYAGTEEDLSKEEWKLLNGGYYKVDGEERYIDGLKKALAYLAYSRFVRNHSAVVTPFGVVSKMGDDSNPTDSRTVAAISKDAQRIGHEMLDDALRYWKYVSGPAGKERPHRRRFVAIGD